MNTPTENEREALANLIRRDFYRVDGLPDDEDRAIADVVLEAGFRRTVQGEPSDAQLAEMEQRVYDEHRPHIAGMAKALVRAGWDAALRAAAATQEGENR